MFRTNNIHKRVMETVKERIAQGQAEYDEEASAIDAQLDKEIADAYAMAAQKKVVKEEEILTKIFRLA